MTRTSSPLIANHVLARYPAASRRPAPHTPAELGALLDILRAVAAATITIGHGRHSPSVAAAAALAIAWTGAGGSVLDIVDWPASAASWLRPARRLVAGHPDAWVIADTPAGFAQLARRLADQPTWAANRTVGTASLDSADLIALAGSRVVTGLRGVTTSGGTWRVGHDILVRDESATRIPATR